MIDVVEVVLALDQALGPSKQFIHRERLARGCRVGQQEVVQIVDCFCVSQLAEREVALRPRCAGLYQRTHNTCA